MPRITAVEEVGGTSMRTLVLLALATALVSTAAGAASNYEDITAPSGTIPTGNGPIWQAPDVAVLYNNGPLITNIGTCPGGTNESQIRPGGTIFGYGHQVSANNRVADNFTVPAGQQWEIQAITFFAYQTGAGSGAPSINQVTLQLWNGRPGDAGSQVICGATTNNVLALSQFAQIYRTVNTAPCPGATTRAIFADICTLPGGCPPCLQPGTYWLDWNTGGNAAFSGPWQPPVTPRPATANGRQSLAGVWGDAVDTGDGLIDDFPFIIEGVQCGATPVENSTWGAIKSQWK
jgi:hypothetical protein